MRLVLTIAIADTGADAAEDTSAPDTGASDGASGPDQGLDTSADRDSASGDRANSGIGPRCTVIDPNGIVKEYPPKVDASSYPTDVLVRI